MFSVQTQRQVEAHTVREIMTHGEFERDPLWRPLNRHELDDAETKRRLQHWHTPAASGRFDAHWLQAALPADADEKVGRAEDDRCTSGCASECHTLAQPAVQLVSTREI